MEYFSVNLEEKNRKCLRAIFWFFFTLRSIGEEDFFMTVGQTIKKLFLLISSFVGGIVFIAILTVFFIGEWFSLAYLMAFYILVGATAISMQNDD